MAPIVPVQTAGVDAQARKQGLTGLQTHRVYHLCCDFYSKITKLSESGNSTATSNTSELRGVNHSAQADVFLTFDKGCLQRGHSGSSGSVCACVFMCVCVRGGLESGCCLAQSWLLDVSAQPSLLLLLLLMPLLLSNMSLLFRAFHQRAATCKTRMVVSAPGRIAGAQHARVRSCGCVRSLSVSYIKKFR